MDTYSLGDRMKRYEAAQSMFMTRRLPVIIRIDGKAFHTPTRKVCEGKGFDEQFAAQMCNVMVHTAEAMQGCVVAYWQSDEVSFCLTDYRTIATDAWFGYKAQKLASVAAGTASAVLTKLLGVVAVFDARVFTVPHDEVCNYFIWRQQDATRNAIQMLGQTHFSAKQLHKKTCNNIQDMLMEEKGINFNDCPTWQKRGACYIPLAGTHMPDVEIPIFSQDREYIEQRVFCRED